MSEHRSTGHPVANQIRQRKAVGAALDRQRVFVSSMRFRSNEEPSYRVIVSNEAYIVHQRGLDLLLGGSSPQELGFEPISGETGE